MAFTVEDGTGLAGANSFAAVATADTYWADRGNTVWSGASPAQRQQALVRSTDYIKNQKRYRWSGAKLTYAQPLPFPREGAVEQDGLSVPNNVVPLGVVEACCYLALVALADILAGGAGDLQPALARGGMIQSETVADISVSYFEGAANETVYPYVDGLMATLMRRTALQSTPEYYEPEIPAGFETDQFQNNQ